MKNTIITTLLLALVLLVASCGGGTQQPQAQGGADSTAKQTTEPQKTAEQPAAEPQKTSAILAEMQKSNRISDTAKRVFEAINFQDPAELDDDGCCVWENGFDASFKNGGEYQFRVYDKWDGTQIALMTKYNGNYGSDDDNYYQLPETTIWQYDGAKAEKITSQIQILPVPEIEDFLAWRDGDKTLQRDKYHLNLDKESIQYVAQSKVKGDEDDFENPGLYLSYTWNGENFVNEHQPHEYVAFKIWKNLKPRFQKEFGLNVLPEVSDGSIYVEQGDQQMHVRRIHYYLTESNDNWSAYKVYLISDDCSISNETRNGTYTIEEYFSTVQATSGDLRGNLHGIQPELKDYQTSETLNPYIEGDILTIRDTENDNAVVAKFKFSVAAEKFIKQ